MTVPSIVWPLLWSLDVISFTGKYGNPAEGILCQEFFRPEFQ
jgi:hypothetical protein